MSPNLFDTLLEPVFILDENSIIIYCNETASQLLDSNPRKIIRSKLVFNDTFMFSENLDFLAKIKDINEPTPYKEVSFTTSTNHDGKAQLTLQPFQENKWVLFFRDVTLEERLQKKYRAELEQKEDVIEDLKQAQAQLEIYSKQLENLVEERTKEVISLNKMMKALLDSLNQAFFIFYKDGSCSPIFSKACHDILETTPENKKIWDILNLKSDKIEGFQKWSQTLFSEMLPFEDLAPLGPSSRPHSLNKEIALQYYPIRNSDSQIEAVVCVATDITDLVFAHKQAELDRAKVDSILKMVQHKKQIELFFLETEKEFKNILNITENDLHILRSEEILRFLHTLKGGAASFSYLSLKEKCHICESYFIDNKSNFSNDVKLNFNNILQDINNSFIDNKKNYESMFGKINHIKTMDIEQKDFEIILGKLPLDSFLNFLQDKYLSEPVSFQISYYQDIINQTAQNLNKKLLPIKFTGTDIKIPKQRFDALFQVLIHALRNSVDHGIESSEQRELSGKPAYGQISIAFQKSSDNLTIQIKDDGQGINPNKIRNRLAQNNSPLVTQSDQEIIYRIFDPSFSTKQEVSEISGRGIGMDAILTEVKKLQGNIKIQTQIGLFTEFIITIPLIEKTNSSINKVA